MPDFNDIENLAKTHSSEVDKGIEAAGQEVEKLDGGKDHGMVEKGEQAIEKELGGDQGSGDPSGQQPGGQ